MEEELAHGTLDLTSGAYLHLKGRDPADEVRRLYERDVMRLGEAHQRSKKLPFNAGTLQMDSPDAGLGGDGHSEELKDFLDSCF